jgi:hypothetical protein
MGKDEIGKSFHDWIYAIEEGGDILARWQSYMKSLLGEWDAEGVTSRRIADSLRFGAQRERRKENALGIPSPFTL